MLRRVILLLALVAAPLAPSVARGQPATGGWSVRRDAFAEAWFDGLAQVGAPRYGPFGLYATAERPTAASALARVAPRMRIAMSGDSAYDVLHFVALFFVGERPEAALGALRVALTDGAPSPAPSGLARRATAVAGALPTAAHRAHVRGFVDALDDAWRQDAAAVRGRRGPDGATLAALQRRWQVQLEPMLAPFLAAVGRERGVIVPVAALGLEGRIARAEAGRTVVAVASGAPGDTITPLLAAVRELGFALLDRTPGFDAGSAPRGVQDRLAAQRDRDVAALRAGAMVLDRLAPAWSRDYRRLYGGPAAAAPEQFARAFPLTPSAEVALQAAVAGIAPRNAAVAPP